MKQVKDLMTRGVRTLGPQDTVVLAAQAMEELDVGALPVLDRDKRLVGILSLGDLAAKGDVQQAGAALADISEPSRPTRTGPSAARGPAGGGETL